MKTAAILGGNVTVGGSGCSEFQQYIESGKVRAIAMKLAGPEFDEFVDSSFASLRATMVKAGMI
jgi:hypothetical protein